MAYSWFDILSIVLNLILGGGLIITFATLKAQKKQADGNASQAVAAAKQAEASAESTEIQNYSQIAKDWREYAQDAEMRYEAMTLLMQKQIASLTRDVNKLSTQLNQILLIIKEINHDNIEQKKQEASDVART